MRPPFHAGHALGLGAALILPIALYANLGVAPLFAVTGLAALITWANRRPVWADSRGPLLILILALPVWALISALWSITPGESIKTGASLLGTCIGGAVIVSTAASMTARERDVFIAWIIWGGAAGFALMFVDLFFDGPVYRLLAAAKGAPVDRSVEIAAGMKAGVTVGALFAWCWGCALHIRYGRRVCAAGLVFAAAAISVSGSETPVLAFVSGGAASAVFFMFGKISERRVRIVSAALIAAFVLLTPAAVGNMPRALDIVKGIKDLEVLRGQWFVMGSMFNRLVIWQTAADHIAESPLAGLGFDTSRALYSAADRVNHLQFTAAGEYFLGSTLEPIPLHPHNAAVQVRLELGLWGALIAAGLLAFLFSSAASVRGAAPRFFASAAFFSALAAASAAFGVWQSWWLGVLFITAASAAALAERPAAESAGPPDPTRYGDWEKSGRCIDF